MQPYEQLYPVDASVPHLEQNTMIDPFNPGLVMEPPVTEGLVEGDWLSIVRGATVSVDRLETVSVPRDLFTYYFYTLSSGMISTTTPQSAPKLQSTLSVGLRQPSIDHPYLTRVIDSIDPKKLILIFAPEVSAELPFEELRSRVSSEVTLIFLDPTWKLPTDYYYMTESRGYHTISDVCGSEISRIAQYIYFENSNSMPMPWHLYICPKERNRLFVFDNGGYTVVEGERFTRLAAGELELFSGSDLNFWTSGTEQSVGVVTRPNSKILRSMVQRTVCLGGTESELLLFDAPDTTSLDDLDHRRIWYDDADYHASFRKWIRNRVPLVMVIFLGGENPIRYQQLMTLVTQHPTMMIFVLEPEQNQLPSITITNHFWCLDTQLEPDEIEVLRSETNYRVQMGVIPTPKMMVPTILRHRETQPNSLLVIGHPLTWLDLDPGFAEKEYEILRAEKADESKAKKKPMITVEAANDIISELQTSEELYEQLCETQQQLEKTHRRLSELIAEYILPYADITKFPIKQVALDM